MKGYLTAWRANALININMNGRKGSINIPFNKAFPFYKLIPLPNCSHCISGEGFLFCSYRVNPPHEANPQNPLTLDGSLSSFSFLRQRWKARIRASS